MRIDEAIQELVELKTYNTARASAFIGEGRLEALDLAIKALEQQTCEDWYDVPSDEMTLEQARQAVKDLRKKLSEVLELEQQPKTGQFAKWVAREIFDDYWEYNKDAFAEIACRKLAMLGKVRAKGDEWELIEELPSVTPKALEQTDGNCISREAVNELIDELARAISDERCFISRGRATSTIMQDILDLPSVTPKAEWIPVSERLPESSGVYIVSRWFTDGFEEAILTDACYFDGTSTWHNDNRINHGREYVDKKIVAWMPLPEPYKAESEG